MKAYKTIEIPFSKSPFPFKPILWVTWLLEMVPSTIVQSHFHQTRHLEATKHAQMIF
jgi:hypothetical protein